MVSQTFTNGRPLRTRKADVGYVLFIGISILLALGMLAPFLPDGQTFVVRWIILANFLFVCWVAWMLYRCYLLDFVPFWPIDMPNWYTAPRAAYIRDYNDPLYILDPPFFKLFLWVELFALVPGGLVVAWALIKDHKLAPLYLLVWATYYVTSTAVCFVEMTATEDWPAEDISRNSPGYIVFGAIGVVMMLDAFSRVKLILLGKQKNA